jgi:amino acid transporter
MQLKRTLNRIETVALSVAVIAMTVGMALNTPFVAATSGAAVPLVYIISTVGVLCIALSFVRLASKIGHAGSVYGLIRYAQGRNPGFIAGWALLLTYTLFIASALFGFGLFASMLFDPIVKIAWPVYSVACGILVWWVTYRDIKLSTRLMLSIEFLSILLLIIVAMVILHKQPASAVPFQVGGAGIVGISQGLVFGVMTFIGFEAAASLGEESRNAFRDVPFAIVATVLIGGAFFTFVSYAQTIGFGLDNVKAFAAAATPMNDLTSHYLGEPFNVAIKFGALISNLAMAVGSASAASRLLLALARDGFLPRPVASINSFGSPKLATHVVMALNMGLVTILPFVVASASDLYGYVSTIATLTVLIAYGMMNLATLTHFARQDLQTGKPYRLVPPIIGLLLSAYVLFANVYPVPAAPFSMFPYVAAAYMLIGGAIMFLSTRKDSSRAMDAYVFHRVTPTIDDATQEVEGRSQA